jgi:hypothetical protein
VRYNTVLGELKYGSIVHLTNGIVDQTIELESPQELIGVVMATCPKSTASLGARIEDLRKIQRVFGGPDSMALLFISPMELWIEQLS